MHSDDALSIAATLLDIKAVKLSPDAPFQWASGIASPIYCDNRKILSYPTARRAVRDAFVRAAAQWLDIQVIAGVASAGVPHGVLLAEALDLPFIYVRDKAKGHGLRNRIEGEVPAAGTRILVIEDLISTGGSSLEAVAALRDAGLEVVGVQAIFTYNFAEADRRFAAANCALATITDYTTLVEIALAHNYISNDEFNLLKKWRTSVFC